MATTLLAQKSVAKLRALLRDVVSEETLGIDRPHAAPLGSQGASPHPPPVFDCCYEPVTTKALDSKKQKLVHEAAEAGEKEPKVTDLDTWALVVRVGVRSTPDSRSADVQLASYAKQHCGEAMAHALWRRRHQLANLIDGVWKWENIEATAAETHLTRVQILESFTSPETPCECRG